MKVHRDIVTANVRGHCNDGCLIKLSDQVAGRDAVQVGHDDIHENQIVF